MNKATVTTIEDVGHVAHPKAVAASVRAYKERCEKNRRRSELKAWTRKYKLRFFEFRDTTFCVHQRYKVLTISTALFNPNDKRRDVPLGRYIAAERWVEGERIQLKLPYSSGEWWVENLLRNMA